MCTDIMKAIAFYHICTLGIRFTSHLQMYEKTLITLSWKLHNRNFYIIIIIIITSRMSIIFK